jgi:hypothetical protein
VRKAIEQTIPTKIVVVRVRDGQVEWINDEEGALIEEK